MPDATPRTRQRLSRRVAGALVAAFVAATTTIVPLPALITPAHAAWPDRPIRFIVPFPPGGGTDFLAREIATRLTATFGWTVVVDNRPGAGGNIGLEAAAHAPPDGYTIVMGQTSNLAINPALHARLPYNALRDFAPVTLVASAPLVMVVRPDRPWRTFADLVAHARASNAAVAYASPGAGTVGHLAGELVRLRAKLPMIHVPYKGAAPAITDLLGGQVDVYFSTLPAAVAQVKAGKLRALAVTTSTRSPVLPDVPGMTELGYPQIDAASWYGVLAPIATPADPLTQLSVAISRVLRLPETAQRVAQEGGEVIGGSSDLFAVFLRAEQSKWAQIVRQSGAKAD